jgi:hypothetical protein
LSTAIYSIITSNYISFKQLIPQQELQKRKKRKIKGRERGREEGREGGRERDRETHRNIDLDYLLFASAPF